MLFNPELTIWLYNTTTDMRKSIDGLSVLVSSVMEKNPTKGGELFLFYNRNNDKLKILYWDKNGFCLWYKRLVKGRFKIPKGGANSMSYEQLRWLLDGLDIENLQPNPRLNYENFY